MEKKIEALPSLSLEEFQQKKKQQRTKKKKIIQKSFVKKHISDVNIDCLNYQTKKAEIANNLDDKDEEEQFHLVGSQKRKARKQTITRNTAGVNVMEQNNVTDNESNKSKHF